jgi:uncharacterized protein YjbI with pentapeptide repeats
VNKRNMSKKGIRTPNFPKHELEKGLPEANIQARGYYAQLVLSQGDLSEQTAERVSFDQVLWQNVQLSKTHFAHVQLLDCRLNGCDLANADWREASLSRVELIDCHLTGIQWSEGHFQDVLFKGCHGSFIQFALATCKNVRFEDCDLSDANFLDVDLSGVTFVRCNLQHADLMGTKLVGVDLRGSQIDGARVGLQEMKGALIDHSQALAFVRSMGIEVAASTEL